MNSLLNSGKIFVLQSKSVRKTFEVTHQQFSEGQLEKTMQYDMEVALLSNVNPNVFMYEIDRHNVLIDGNEPDTIFDQLSFECGNALFPLKFLANKSGEIIQIYEHQKVIERWEAIKEKLLNYYEGDSAVNYIHHTDRNIKNQDIIKKMLSNHMFIYFYFKPLYVSYENNNSAKTKWKVAPFMDFEHDIDMLQTLKMPKSNNVEQIVPNDEVQIEVKSDSNAIEIEAKYTFHPRYNSIDSCEASMMMDYGKQIKIAFITKQNEMINN